MGLLLVAMLMGAGADVPRELRPGVLHGRVVDVEEGVALTDVAVTVHGILTGDVPITLTDSEGRFRFHGLPPGLYTLSFEQEGYEAYSVFDIRLRGDRVVRVEVELAPEAFVPTEESAE